MDSEIRDCLLDLNPWQRDPSRFQQEVADRSPGIFVPRMIDQAGFEDTAQAKMIVGPRQAGKSTFVWSLIRDREPRSVMFRKAEERRVRRWAGSPACPLRVLCVVSRSSVPSPPHLAHQSVPWNPVPRQPGQGTCSIVVLVVSSGRLLISWSCPALA